MNKWLWVLIHFLREKALFQVVNFTYGLYSKTAGSRLVTKIVIPNSQVVMYF